MFKSMREYVFSGVRVGVTVVSPGSPDKVGLGKVVKCAIEQLIVPERPSSEGLAKQLWEVIEKEYQGVTRLQSVRVWEYFGSSTYWVEYSQ